MEVDMKEFNKKRQFRFEAFWLRDPTFLEKAKGWWESSQAEGQNRMNSFQLRLKDVKQQIKKWNKTEFGNIQHDKERLQGEMKQIQQQMILNGRAENLFI